MSNNPSSRDVLEKQTNEFFDKTINELEKEVEADLAGKKNEK